MGNLKHSGLTYERRAKDHLRKAAKNLDRARRKYKLDDPRDRYGPVVHAEKKVRGARHDLGDSPTA